jgi:hypothetical protein
MKTLVLMFLLSALAGIAAAETLMPMAEGTTWKYDLVQEKISDSLDLDEANELEKIPVTYHLGGIEHVDNRELRKLEIYRGEILDSVDLIAVEQNEIICPARSDANGTITKLAPPQIMVATPLTKGKSWTFDGTVGEKKVSQRYEIADEEEIEVPAGKFHAWRIHCEQTAPSSATIDRWFVPGTGFVKVATVAKGESGIPAQRTWLSLKELPKVAPPKNASGSETAKISGGLSSEPKGEFQTEFKTETPTIYARWHGRGLRQNAGIRAVFIADNVADIPPNSQIDEMETTAAATDSGGSFALSRPEEGWTPGEYRVDLYLDDALAESFKFKIVK